MSKCDHRIRVGHPVYFRAVKWSFPKEILRIMGNEEMRVTWMADEVRKSI